MTIRLSDHFGYRRLLRFTLPSIAMMIFTSIYGVVDGLFVSNFVGKTPFAAVNLIMPFLMILVPIVIAMGYDGVTAVLITYVATQIGFGTSWMNPFSVAIAQGIAGVPVFSGAGFRIGLWIFFTALGAAMTVLYASKIRKRPSLSVSYASDAYFREDMVKYLL